MRMNDGKVHNLTLLYDVEGTEEWYCFVCGRRIFVSWQPKFEKRIAEAGDEAAVHSGSKSRVNLEPHNSGPEQPQTFDEDRWLAPWAKWWENSGFEQLWDDGNTWE